VLDCVSFHSVLKAHQGLFRSGMRRLPCNITKARLITENAKEVSQPNR
jgi:hypothetical protein